MPDPRGGSVRPRFILLTGAPLTKDLSWDEPDLIAGQDGRGIGFEEDEYGPNITLTDEVAPTWRLLDLDRKRHHSDLTQQHCPVYIGLPHGNIEDDERKDGQATKRRTIEPGEEQDHYEVTVSGLAHDTSLSLFDSFLSTSTGPSQLQGPPISLARISNLNELPAAKQVDTGNRGSSDLFNLLVTIISIQPPKLIEPKKGKAEKTFLVRWIVADDTKSSFEVAFFLPAVEQTEPKKHTKEAKDEPSWPQFMEDARQDDIVLMLGMAVRAFRGVISATGSTWSTRLFLLYRDNSDPNATTKPRFRPSHIRMARQRSSLEDRVLSKTVKILDWRDRFLHRSTDVVVHHRYHTREHCNMNRSENGPRKTIELPEDTQ